MRIENIDVKPYEKSIFPGLSFKVEISYTKYEEAIIGVGGWLETDDGRIIAELKEEIPKKTRTDDIGARGSSFDSRFKEEICKKVVIAPLDRRALDHIEKRRMQNRKGDVKLILNLNVKYIKNEARIFHSYSIKPENAGLKPIDVLTSRGMSKGEIVVSAYDSEFSTSQANQWILSGDSSPIFLFVGEQTLKGEKTIHSSDWIHDYAPKLGLGEYFVVEIPKGKKIIEDAWKYVEKAEGCFRRWDSKGAYANCREVGKLLDRIMEQKYGNSPIIKKWKRAIEKFNKLASLDLHVEEIKEEEPKGEVEVGKADTEHILIVTKALIRYTEELLQKT